MALNLDLLDLGILFEDLGDLLEEAVGLFLDRRLVGRKEDLVLDFDLVGRNNDTARNTTVLVCTLLVRALVETLAVEFLLELVVVDPLVAVAVAVRIGSRATIVLSVTSDIGAGIGSLAQILVFAGGTALLDPRIADLVGVVVGVGATIVVLEAVEIFGFGRAFVLALADVGIAIKHTLLRNPRIAEAVAIDIGIRATVVLDVAGNIRAKILALAECAEAGEILFRNPGIADLVAIAIGVGATKEFCRAGNFRTIVDIVEHAVAVAVANNNLGRRIATEADTNRCIRLCIEELVFLEAAFFLNLGAVSFLHVLDGEIFEVFECGTEINCEHVAGIETELYERTGQKTMAIPIEFRAFFANFRFAPVVTIGNAGTDCKLKE